MRKAFWLLALLAFALPTSVQAQNNEEVNPDNAATTIRIASNNIKLEYMFRLVSSVTGHTFLVGPQAGAVLTQEIKIVAANGLEFPRAAAFNVLQALLKQQNQPQILMPFGDDSPTSRRFYEVVQVANAVQSQRDEDIVILENIEDFKSDGAGYVTLVAKLKNLTAATLRTSLQPFTTQQTSSRGVQAVGNNMIMISDYVSNIRRIGKIISLLDRAGPMPRLEVIHIHHMDAVELQAALDELLNERGQLLTRLAGSNANATLREDEESVSIAVAPNQNSLIVQGLDAGIQMVRELKEKLDVPIPGLDQTRGRIHKYKARNVLASELADTLNALVGQGIDFRTQEAPVVGPNQRPIPTVPTGSSAFSDFQPVIEFDDVTNQLLIIAKPSDYIELLRVIEALDIRRPQVMIEAAILEVRKDDDFTYGAEIAAIDGSGSGARVSGGTVFGFSDIVDSAGVPINSGGGEPAGRSPIFGTGGILTLNSGGPFDIPLLLRFLQSQSDVNVLSVPRIMANDNQESSIEITTEVATLNSNSENGVVSDNFRYEEDGITLTVTPQISEDNYVILNIDLNVDQFTGQPAIQGAPPPRTGRTIRTTVTVPNDQTVIIGGLTSSQSSHSVTKMPFLGDIPILGELFKTETATNRETNLYIFVRPQVFRDRDFGDLKKHSQQAREEAQGKLIKDGTSEAWFKRNADRDDTSTAGRLAGKNSRILALTDIPETE